MFFKKRQPPADEYPLSALDRVMIEESKAAAKFGKQLGKYLDYSPKSLSYLETILETYHRDVAVSHPTENQLWSMAQIFGSYLGETMLKNGLREKGFYWDDHFDDSPIPVLRKENGAYLTPIDRVHKRLVNGEEENVEVFYKFMMDRVDW